MGKSPPFQEMLVKCLGVKFQDTCSLLSNAVIYTNIDRAVHLSEVYVNMATVLIVESKWDSK